MLQVHSFVSRLLQSGSLTTGCLCFIGFIGFGLGFVSLEQGTGKGSSGPDTLGLIIWKVDDCLWILALALAPSCGHCYC